jgi:hypothetical protein
MFAAWETVAGINRDRTRVVDFMILWLVRPHFYGEDVNGQGVGFGNRNRRITPFSEYCADNEIDSAISSLNLEPMKTPIAVASLMVAGLLIFAFLPRSEAAFGNDSSRPIGKNCTVQFKRDLLGTARDLPVSPMTGSINGAETSVSGKLKFVTSEWVVITQNERDIWIQKSTVLLMQF